MRKVLRKAEHLPSLHLTPWERGFICGALRGNDAGPIVDKIGEKVREYEVKYGTIKLGDLES